MKTKSKLRKYIAIIISVAVVLAAVSIIIIHVVTSGAGPASGTVQSSSSGRIVLGTIGRYCPDSPAAWEVDPYEDKYMVHNDLVKEIDSISEADWASLRELEKGYLQKSVKDFRLELAGIIENSPTAIDAISTLAYAGMHDPFTEPNDFYTSLFFSLTEYYQNSGNPHVQDAYYMLGFHRYFGPKHDTYTELNFDIMKYVVLSYDIDIEYIDVTITIAQRNQTIADTIGAVNRELGALTFAEWSNPEINARLSSLIDSALRENGSPQMRFDLLRTTYEFTETELE